MSFAFKWDAFSSQTAFQTQIRQLLTSALNKKLPGILEDKITVLNLDWGDEAPTLEMLEIGDVALDRFRGVFKLNYNGGATVTVATKVQANLLNVYQHSAPSRFTTPKFVDANASFPIPLHLTLRKIRLQGTVIVVFSKSKGLTLVFRNDPLQSIEVSSTFDTFPAIASFLQQQIENQIRGLFREEVPAVLYRLSLKYLPSYNQSVIMDQAARLKNENSEQPPVAFADIDSDKPVSLVNMLHVEAMLSSRRTLALETPIMPTAIVRSELHHRALLSRLKTPAFNLVAEDTTIYDKLYSHAKYAGMRNANQKPPKRRVIRRKKPESAATTATATNTTTASTSTIDQQQPAALDKSQPNAGSSKLPYQQQQCSAASDKKGRDHYQPHIHVRIPGLDSYSQRIPVAPIVRDAKGLAPFMLGSPQRIIFPHQFLHGDELQPLPVHEIDELPPAYAA